MYLEIALWAAQTTDLASGYQRRNDCIKGRVLTKGQNQIKDTTRR